MLDAASFSMDAVSLNNETSPNAVTSNGAMPSGLSSALPGRTWTDSSRTSAAYRSATLDRAIDERYSRAERVEELRLLAATLTRRDLSAIDSAFEDPEWSEESDTTQDRQSFLSSWNPKASVGFAG